MRTSVLSLAGFREVIIRETKTKVDWAISVAKLLEGRYADCEKLIIACDSLNTHTKGALYEVFEPERARNLRSPGRISLHTQTWQLAEHRRELT